MGSLTIQEIEFIYFLTNRLFGSEPEFKLVVSAYEDFCRERLARPEGAV